MEKQQILKEKYLLKLKGEIDADKYRSNEFVFDKKQTLMMPNILKSEGLAEKLNPEIATNNMAENKIFLSTIRLLK